MIDGRTRVTFIVGDPIAQVRSPQQMNPAFDARRIDAVMLPMHVEPPAFRTVVRSLRHVRNLAGLIITVPHKEAALRECAALSDTARAIGSVNAMRPTAKGWEGHNSDGEGFVRGLLDKGFDPVGRNAFVAGLGGAGKSVAFALAARSPARLTAHDVDAERLARVLANLQRHHPRVDVRSAAAPGPSDDLIVNCTPLGMRATDPLPFDVSTLHRGQVVADIVAQPETTALLQAALDRGCRVHPGKWMLHYQIDDFIEFFRLAPALGDNAGDRHDRAS